VIGLVAPSLWRLDVVNAVLKKERQRLISEADGNAFLRALDGLGVEVVEQPINRTLEQLAVARPHQLTSYDAAYLELALGRNAKLLSLDSNLLNAAARLGVFVIADEE